MFCNRCRQELPDGSDFCINCGADLRTARQMTTPPESARTPPPRFSGETIGDRETVLGGPTAQAVPTGQVIADRFEVLEALGHGGMGAVYKVFDRELGDECALKIMHPELLSNERAVKRFVQEARVSLTLQHPGIVRVRDIGRDGETRFLTMELLEGRTLRDWQSQVAASGRDVPLANVVRIVGDILDALAYAHRYTVHRDVKPENVFLVGDPLDPEVKLLDFGIAKAIDIGALTSRSSSLGTALYMAPEQRKGAADVDARADVFSVGVVLYEMLTGELPGPRCPVPSELRRDLDGTWDDLVFAALETAPERRPSGAAEMAERLRALLQRSPQHDADAAPPPVDPRWATEQTRRTARTPPPAPPRAEPPPATGKKSGSAWLGLIVLGAIVIGAVWGWNWWQSREVFEEPPVVFRETDTEEPPTVVYELEPESDFEPTVTKTERPPAEVELQTQPRNQRIFSLGGDSPPPQAEALDLDEILRDAWTAVRNGDTDAAWDLIEDYLDAGGNPDATDAVVTAIDLQDLKEELDRLIRGRQLDEAIFMTWELRQSGADAAEVRRYLSAIASAGGPPLTIADLDQFSDEQGMTIEMDDPGAMDKLIEGEFIEDEPVGKDDPGAMGGFVDLMPGEVDGFGKVIFEVRPKDARVFLDDELLGMAFDLNKSKIGRRIAAGMHFVRVERKGYATEIYPLPVMPDVTSTVVLELIKE